MMWVACKCAGSTRSSLHSCCGKHCITHVLCHPRVSSGGSARQGGATSVQGRDVDGLEFRCHCHGPHQRRPRQVLCPCTSCTCSRSTRLAVSTDRLAMASFTLACLRACVCVSWWLGRCVGCLCGECGSGVVIASHTRPYLRRWQNLSKARPIW